MTQVRSAAPATGLIRKGSVLPHSSLSGLDNRQRVVQRGAEAFGGDLRVGFEDLFATRTTGQQLEEELDADPSAADARLAPEDVGAAFDPVRR